MPLNEHEERILHEIERRFYAHDPESARRIESTTLPGYLARNCRWAALGLVAGLIILLVGFASSWIVGIFGFVVMLASGVSLIHNLRRIGRVGMAELRQTIRSRSLPEAIDDASKRLRKRFGRDED